MTAWRLARAVLLGLAIFYVLAVGALFVLQRRMLFPAPAEPREPRLRGLTLLEIAGPERPVSAFYFAAREGLPTVVYFHGNGEQLADEVPLAFSLHQQGLGFLGVEYPGYGLDRAGVATEQSLLAAAERAFIYLRETLHVPDARVVLMAHSLGTGVAVQMAARGHGTRMLLLSAFTSIPDAAAAIFRFVPVHLLVRDAFESARFAPRVNVPVLLVHGTRDNTVPYALGQRLTGLFPHARLLTVEGATHNDLLDRPAVSEAVTAFLLRGDGAGPAPH